MRRPFPDLIRHGILDLALTGSIKGSHEIVRKIFSENFPILSSAPMIACKIYHGEEGKNFASINVGSEEGKFSRLGIKITNRPHWRVNDAYVTLDDRQFISFFKKIESHPELEESRFAVSVGFRVPFKQGMSLPFDFNARTPVQVSGVKIRFDDSISRTGSPPRFKFIIVEKVENDVRLFLSSNPIFSLQADFINEHFFDAVINFSEGVKEAILKGAIP